MIREGLLSILLVISQDLNVLKVSLKCRLEENWNVNSTVIKDVNEHSLWDGVSSSLGEG